MKMPRKPVERHERRSGRQSAKRQKRHRWRRCERNAYLHQLPVRAVKAPIGSETAPAPRNAMPTTPISPSPIYGRRGPRRRGRSRPPKINTTRLCRVSTTLLSTPPQLLQCHHQLRLSRPLLSRPKGACSQHGLHFAFPVTHHSGNGSEQTQIHSSARLLLGDFHPWKCYLSPSQAHV